MKMATAATSDRQEGGMDMLDEDDGEGTGQRISRLALVRSDFKEALRSLVVAPPGGSAIIWQRCATARTRA